MTKRKFKEALKNSYGNVTVIAKKLDCERVSVYRYMEKHPEIKKLLELERERIIDLAENKLVEKVNDGDGTLIALVCKTLGKNRGYVEKQIQDITLKHFDPSQLTDKQLERIKAGEDPLLVLAQINE